MRSILIQKAEVRAATGQRHRLLPVAVGVILGVAFSAIGFKLSPEMIPIFTAATIASVAGMLSPSLAFILVALVVPIERMGRLLDDSAINMISLMRLAGLLALLSYGVHALIHRWMPRIGSPILFYGGYFLMAALTLLYTNDRAQSLRMLGMIIGNLLFFFLVTNIARNWRLVQLAISAWIMASVAIGVFTIYTWHFSGSVLQESEVGTVQARFATAYEDVSEWESLRKVERAIGPTSSPAVYGINMILTIPFLLYLMRIARSSTHRGLCFIAFGIVVYNIFLTNTRATIVGGVVALA